jgi:hypothetical protein
MTRIKSGMNGGKDVGVNGRLKGHPLARRLLSGQRSRSPSGRSWLARAKPKLLAFSSTARRNALNLDRAE